MLIVIVQAQVKPEHLEAFLAATLENARNSVQEPGIARFDVMQQSDDPTRVTLYEVYRSEDAPARHRETAHYLRWRDTVAEMLVEPRKRTEYHSLFPGDSDWG